ncbi:hypothetical protein TH25_02180 [Thalassospira profundimaris]|uniref:Uncharacterized protein n=1 Tax=Thalassospira profundimaris TaxID=502049 RepID=A0A367XKG5_9PROT|nr:PD-(D/E)XK nuclease family protein [Thalassospira profundimaris]RCK54154.1 hypothetical protein TH25_02180 [Thalassospira profundimaris]
MLKVDYKYLAAKTNVTFSSAPVYRVSGLLNKDLRVFLKSYVKEQKIPSHPEEYKRSISSIYCIDRANHFLETAPYEWLSLIETQVTKGLAYFLRSGNDTQNRSRVQTLVSAFGIASAVENQNVEAESRNNDNTRIDLIIKWDDGAMRNQIIIEAKLNYELRENQLKLYSKNTNRKKEKFDNCYFYVISEARTRITAEQLKENNSWKWVSWSSLLLKYEKFKNSVHDDDDFRRFRKTLWNRTKN